MLMKEKVAQQVRSDFEHLLPGRNQRITLRPRLLIVEDDRDLREALSLSITECGFDVLEAEDGVRGIWMAERDAPHLVLLDLMLPQRSGIVVLKELKARLIRRIPVIMMSGSSDPRHRELAAAQGADAFIQKPFGETEFLSAVRSFLPETKALPFYERSYA